MKAEHPEVTRALAAQMQRFLAYRVDAPAAELSAEDRESLRAMGYLQDE